MTHTHTLWTFSLCFCTIFKFFSPPNLTNIRFRLSTMFFWHLFISHSKRKNKAVDLRINDWNSLSKLSPVRTTSISTFLVNFSLSLKCLAAIQWLVWRWGRGHTLPPLYFKDCLFIRTDLTSSCTYRILICT